MLSLPPNRHPVWRLLGLGLTAGTLLFTGVFMVRGVRPLQPTKATDLFLEPKGTLGTITEQLGTGRFVLSYEAIHGAEEDLYLSGVTGRLEEPELLWRMASPAAHRRQGFWTLEGPLGLATWKSPEGADAQQLGRGSVSKEGPALRWDQGAWEGLAPLTWEELEGGGRGLWQLPTGWRRDIHGNLSVPAGPVIWESRNQGALNRLTARTLWAEKGFSKARMSGVSALVEGGALQAGSAEADPTRLTWGAPIQFQRDDGWTGSAEGGEAPRPGPGESLNQLEFRTFQATRPAEGGPHHLRAEGVRWTSAGLRLEGDVHWGQTLQGQPLEIRAPRVLLREGEGPDLPADLPIGEGWAEGQALLTWGRRTLGSPRIEVRRGQKSWKLQAPVFGRAEDGTFTAGEGRGSPMSWSFQGPVQVQFFDGSTLRATRLTWEHDSWILTGGPVTWTRLRERLTGPRVIRRNEQVRFPEGLSGAMAAPEGDLSVHAMEGVGDGQRLTLEGQVVCQGQGWRLEAGRLQLTLGPGRVVHRVVATGSVVLRGRMGEGRGEALELDLKGNRAQWTGRVRGLADAGS